MCNEPAGTNLPSPASVRMHRPTSGLGVPVGCGAQRFGHPRPPPRNACRAVGAAAGFRPEWLFVACWIDPSQITGTASASTDAAPARPHEEPSMSNRPWLRVLWMSRDIPAGCRLASAPVASRAVPQPLDDGGDLGPIVVVQVTGDQGEGGKFETGRQLRIRQAVVAPVVDDGVFDVCEL